MKFSLVIGTLNRKQELDRFLDSLKKQTYTNFELIVVDQNQDGLIDDLMEKYGKLFTIKHIKVNFKGLSKARNEGLKYVGGDIIGFPDDDCVYPKNLLEQVKDIFELDKSIDVLCGRPVNFEGRTTAGKFLKRKSVVNIYKSLFVFCSFTMFFRSEVLKTVGLFDENLGLGSQTPFGSSEDLDIGIRALRLGYKILYDPEVVVFHPEKENLFNRDVAIRARNYATGTGYVLKKHKVPLWYLFFYAVRPIAGVFLSILTLNKGKAIWHLQKFWGRIKGYYYAMR
ncbi:MAG: glycosyltransferase, partial [Nitrospiraceae bacterium]|nr:glycosyltransferase [Nitrospiraceae bacterium]